MLRLSYVEVEGTARATHASYVHALFQQSVPAAAEPLTEAASTSSSHSCAAHHEAIVQLITATSQPHRMQTSLELML